MKWTLSTGQSRPTSFAWLYPREHGCRRPLILGVAALLITTSAKASVNLGGSELSLKASVAHEYDSNIFGNNLEIDDQHSVATPELVLARDRGVVTLDAHAGAHGHRFKENTEEDSWDPFVEGKLNLLREETKIDGTLEGSAKRVNEANPDVNTRTQSDEIRAFATFGHFPTAKVGYRVGGNYSDSNFESKAFSDVRSYQFEGAARYQYSARSDFFIGYGYRVSSAYYAPVGIMANDSDDQKIKVGVAGEIFPKVTGTAAVGWVERTTEGIDLKHSAALIDTSLTWRPDDDSSVSLIAKRDFDTTPIDQSVLRLETGLEARRQWREKWELTVGVSHLRSEYIASTSSHVDRTDSFYGGRLVGSYQLTRQFKLEARASYYVSDSTLPVAEYNRFRGGLALVALF
jgi:hypothetical protein